MKYTLLLMMLGGLAGLISAQAPIFYAQNGLVIVEVESTTSDLSNWELTATPDGYTGKGLLLYKGSDQFSNPGASLLSYRIYVDRPGRYRFQWHSCITMGESNTEHNDSWLRIPDATDFYGEKTNGERVHPVGKGMLLTPVGASVDGWFKVYQNSLDGWTWHSSTSDNDPHPIYAEFDTVGVYTVEISGRSSGHGINRFVLYHVDSVPFFVALDLGKSASPTKP